MEQTSDFFFLQLIRHFSPMDTVHVLLASVMSKPFPTRFPIKNVYPETKVVSLCLSLLLVRHR